MTHYQNHLYAIRISDRKVVSIDDVPNGKNCDCICSKCKETLIAKNGGKINIHHFSHSNESNCRGETLAHIEAKNIIEKEGYLWLPRYVGKDEYDEIKVNFDEILVEEKINNSNYSADLWCTSKGKSIAVEIVVTHDLDQQQESFSLKTKEKHEHGKHPNSIKNLKPYKKGETGNPNGKPTKYAKLKKALDKWGNEKCTYDFWDIPPTSTKTMKDQVHWRIWHKAIHGDNKCIEILAQLGCLDD